MTEQNSNSELLTLAYLTGFFDGEGCVTLGKNGSVTLSVVNTNLPTLKLFQVVFGGYVTPRKQKINKDQHVWRVYGSDALEVAKQLLQLSIEKKDQLKVVIDWFQLRERFKAIQTPERKGRFSHPDRKLAIEATQKILTKMKKEDTLGTI